MFPLVVTVLSVVESVTIGSAAKESIP